MPIGVQKTQTSESSNNDHLKAFGRGVISSLGCIAIGHVLGYSSSLPASLISGIGIGYLMQNPHPSLEDRQTQQFSYRIGLALVAATSISSYTTAAVTLSFLALSNLSSYITVDTFFSKGSKMHSFVDNAIEYASFLSNLFDPSKVRKVNALKNKHEAEKHVKFTKSVEQEPIQSKKQGSNTSFFGQLFSKASPSSSELQRHRDTTPYAQQQRAYLESQARSLMSDNSNTANTARATDSIYDNVSW